MANDPRSFTVKPCAKDLTRRTSVSAKKRNFLNNLTNLGDLEPLNDIGFGKVGKGLRTLSAVSDSIRVGKSVVPGREGSDVQSSILGKIANTALDAVDQGAGIVLDATGLEGAVGKVGGLNVGTANRAYGQAKNIYQRVKQGNFGLTDIPEVFSDLQNLETLTRGIFGGGSGATPRSRELCEATPYARDLIAYAPKFKFLFIVDITFAPEYSDWTSIGSEMAFVVKTSTRPKFNVEYEDVNMYGFRTRAPKRVEYQPINMSFYDDNKNAAHQFYVAYMRAMSPIANIKNKSPQSGMYETSGMDYTRGPSASTFSQTSPATLGHSASLGPLLGSTTSIIQSIKLHHVYDYGNKMNTYHMYNPRITTFNPSDLSQLETGDGTEYEFEFAFDGLFIDHQVNLENHTAQLKLLTSTHGMRPIDPVYATDSVGGSAVSQTGGSGTPDSDSAEETAPSSGFLGGFAEGLSSAADGITDAFGNVIGGVTSAAGGLIGSVSGAANNLFGGVVDQAQGLSKNFSKGITGAINQNMTAAQKSLGGLGTTASNAFKAADQLQTEAQAINEVFDGGQQLTAAGKKLMGL